MQEIESLFNKAVAEIEKMLNSKTVVGDPITIEGNTLIPLINVGFGFGVGAGEGSDSKQLGSKGGGTGGGGGVKPVALIIVNADGVRVEPIKSGAASVLEKAVQVAATAAADKNRSKSGEEGEG